MKDKDFYSLLFVCAIIGGLLGFGGSGTVQGMCLGMGMGAAIPVLFIIICS